MKIFNKLRFKSIHKSNISKYLAYAIGEIILVVIGITIAVNINIWQQQKSDTAELERILNIVKSDLESDITETKEIVLDLKFTEQLMQKMLSNDLENKGFSKTCRPCRYILTEYSVPIFKTKGYNLLNAYNKESSNDVKLIDEIIAFYNNHNLSITTNDDFMLSEVMAFMRYLRDNKDWFKAYFNDGICNEDCKSYFESNTYLNKITLVNAVISDALIPLHAAYEKDALSLIDKIKSLNLK